MTDRIVKVLFAACLALFLTPLAALAQATHWVQVEAHATLRTAEEFAARYQQRIGNIAGFRIAGGWYALAVGPFATADEAEARRTQLLAAREIRDDAYVTDDSIYGQQFWPAGGNALAQPPVSDTQQDGNAQATIKGRKEGRFVRAHTSAGTMVVQINCRRKKMITSTTMGEMSMPPRSGMKRRIGFSTGSVTR